MTLGPFGPGAYSGQTSAGVSLTAADVLRLQVTVVHGAGTVLSSGDKEVLVPDAGSTLLLLGSSLMTLGFFARSRKQAATA
jgi:hypothetical protein